MCIYNKMINSEIEQLLKFHLQCGKTKFPSTEWKQCNHHLWTKDKHKTGHQNYGIPAGKKNGVILLDLDAYKWDDDHPFYELCKKENLEKYLKSLGTITVRTGHDGWHLWFKYNNEIKQRDNHELNIDIKSDGGYGVGPGSKMIKQKGKAADSEVGKFGYYREVFRDTNTHLQPMPKELIDWLNKYQQPLGSKKVKTKKHLKTGNKILDTVPQEGNQYDYNIPDNKLKEIVAKLPSQLWCDYSEWLKITTAFKALNRKDVWDIECKKHPSYDKANNYKIWDSITWAHNGMHLVNWMLNQTDDRTLLDYIKLKPIPENKIKNSQYKYESINRRKLGEIVGDEKDSDYVNLEKYKDVFIKSDTATGKTTLLKKYIYKTHQPVLSIVSRVSLADSHYNDFIKQGINIYNYHITDKSHWLYEDGDSVVITIESIKRVAHLDFSEYVIFLDEFDSLIKHLLKSPTIKNRTVCWNTLRRMIKECKQVVAVDADIHSDRMKFLKDLGRDITIIENQYKHNKGIKMREVYNYDKFIEEINKVDDKLISCDSKNCAEMIFNEIVSHSKAKPIKEIESDGVIEYQLYKCEKGKTYALITSDTDEYVDLDEYDIVVFSPKIIYGLDSVRKRPVYAHYKEHTINPRAMLQQVSRCRNIVELVYIFYRKQFREEKYSEKQDVKNEYKKLREYTVDFKDILSLCECNLYEEMLIDLEYEEDCYNTNKYAHFRTGALNKGFVERLAPYQTEMKTLIEKEKEHSEMKEETFNPSDPIHEKINSYLEFPEDVMIENKDLFLKTSELTKFFNISSFFFKSDIEWKQDLKSSEDFVIKKITSNKNKFLFLNKALVKVGIEDKTKLVTTKKISKVEGDLLWEEYKTLFRDRAQKRDLSDEYEVQKWLGGICSKLFGSKIIKTKRINVNGKKINKYFIDTDELYNKRDLIRYKDELIPGGELDFRIGYEYTILKEKLFLKHKGLFKKVMIEIRNK